MRISDWSSDVCSSDLRGLESTIVAPDEDHIRLLRTGPITAVMLHSLTSLPVPGAQGGTIAAPGQLLSHYAPSKQLRLNAAYARPDEFLIGIGVMDCDLNLRESGDLQQARSEEDTSELLSLTQTAYAVTFMT